MGNFIVLWVCFMVGREAVDNREKGGARGEWRVAMGRDKREGK